KMPAHKPCERKSRIAVCCLVSGIPAIAQFTIILVKTTMDPEHPVVNLALTLLCSSRKNKETQNKKYTIFHGHTILPPYPVKFSYQKCSKINIPPEAGAEKSPTVVKKSVNGS